MNFEDDDDDNEEQDLNNLISPQFRFNNVKENKNSKSLIINKN